ncbi:MAG: sulfatase-like hydrolase/transferase [Chitinophagaceae bacterium]
MNHYLQMRKHCYSQIFFEKNFKRAIFFLFIFLTFSACQKDFKNIDDQIANEGNSVTGRFDPGKSKPNIILIIVDDMGYEIPTFTGGQSYNTPNLDFMAKRGIQFTQAYCHPDGFPSRLAAMTGKYNFRNYITWGILPPGEKTIGNMLQDAGYATCFVGKWQNDGGDQRIHDAGFQSYLAFLPYNNRPLDDLKHRYKSPNLYENGAYLPDSVTHGKYSEDLNVEYLNSFIDSNTTRPFFAIYSMPLVQRPWSPTPDDPEYADWDPNNGMEDIKYFPSMVNYMDKKIGEILTNLLNKGLRGKTLVIVTTDNGTNRSIKMIYNGEPRNGQKNKTTLWGIRIPLVAMWPAKVPKGQVTDALVDFTDFLPTLADVAGIPEPSDYGILDGVSFYDNMRSIPGRDRTWSFCQWDNNPNDTTPMVRYINDTMYKLYDTPLYDSFYKVTHDVNEKMKLNLSKLNAQQINIRDSFISVLQSEHN